MSLLFLIAEGNLSSAVVAKNLGTQGLASETWKSQKLAAQINDLSITEIAEKT